MVGGAHGGAPLGGAWPVVTRTRNLIGRSYFLSVFPPPHQNGWGGQVGRLPPLPRGAGGAEGAPYILGLIISRSIYTRRDCDSYGVMVRYSDNDMTINPIS